MIYPISNVHVYGIDEAVRASKFPKSVNVDTCTPAITEMTKRLGSCKVGSGHDQMLTGITAIFDLTFSIKAWTEAERYTFLNFISSQSTVWCITKFDIEKQCNEYVDKRIIEIVKEKVDKYNSLLQEKESATCQVTDAEELDRKIKEAYLDILYNVPTGFMLTASMVTNYRALKTIYWQRHNHKLPEWRLFCSQVLQFPKFAELCMYKPNQLT